MLRNVITYFILILLVIILASLWGFYSAIRPFKITSSITPKNVGIDYEPVQFKTIDNVLIKGWFIPNKNPRAKTIILLHGYPADKGNILSSRLFLHEKYHLLFIDFRYLGESAGNYSTLAKNEVLDLRTALQFLHQRHLDEVGVWGFSLGAAVALLTAPDAPEIKAIVAESSYARLDWLANDYYLIPGFNYVMGNLLRLWAFLFLNIDVTTVKPVDAVKKLQIPILFIYSKNDQVIKYRHALLMQAAAKNNPHATFLVIEDLPHGYSMKEGEKIISDFFTANLH